MRRCAQNIYPRAYFESTREMVFEDGNYPVSSDYDRLLTILYGDYMKLPPPEARVCKQHAILVDLERSYEAYRDYLDGMQFEVPTRSIR